MKWSRSCSPMRLLLKREHDRATRPISPCTLLEMTPEQRSSDLSEILILPPSSTLSSQRSRHHIDSGVFNVLDSDHDDLYKISEKLWSKSKELLSPPGLGIARNQDWREDVKPVVHNPPPTIPRKRHQSEQMLLGNTTTTDDLGPLSLRPSRAVELTIPVFRLKDPRPDICVGLSDENLATALEPKWGHISSLISDPHITSLGLRFPFLTVEAKAAATGENLYRAQNQAAVGGSAALQIFKNLSDLQDEQNLGEESLESIENNTRPAQELLSDPILHLAFSVTTEGPIHELWLHFRRSKGEDFYMVCLGTWRTTLKDGSLDFLRHLLAVLRWGSGELKDSIVRVLQGL
ncbi:hypothetical protein BDV26DRAFT_283849 [Aspergillus bertholletiae]|uniref:DUF7924 domain-containing protein n=1 Tax=Aspergillus bertholletiae TaxID=1226010 RepID=A0A5N7AYU8_9EURO|nr:hypothetical protein BDV26DRAFT_283849 [Aspergillus bertholletiae]